MIDTAVVYADLATHQLQRQKSLMILSYCSLEPNRLIDLPTWVPDWSKTTQLHIALGNREFYPFRASGNTDPSATVDGKSLHDEACFVDLVGDLLSFHQPWIASEDQDAFDSGRFRDPKLANYISDNWKSCAALSKISSFYCTESERMSAFLRTAVLDMAPNRGRFGWVPRFTINGDVCAILAGASRLSQYQNYTISACS
jgi:hypothetical protein